MALSFRGPGACLARDRKVFGALIVAGVLACVAAAFAALTDRDGNEDIAAIGSVRSKTAFSLQKGQAYLQIEKVNASDSHEIAEERVLSNYPRAVRTVRFVNPDARNVGINGAVHTIDGLPYVPAEKYTYRADGIASWYGSDFHGRRTANGERYDMHGFSAAHRTMPLPSYARVTNLDNGRSMIVRVNNRGPFVHDRVLDLSTGAAKALDFYGKGTTRVRVEFVGRAPLEGSDDKMLLATLRTDTPPSARSKVMVAAAKPLLPKTGDGKETRSPSER